MDINKQLPGHVNHIEDKFPEICSLTALYGLTLMDLQMSHHNGSINEVSKKIGRPSSELLHFINCVNDYITEDNCPVKIEPAAQFIPTGLAALDRALAGGIPKGRVTEVFGASGCGKSQFLLQLAVQAQLAEPKRCIFISTESGLETKRLQDFIQCYEGDVLMDDVDYIHVEDLEIQDHILNTQLPTRLQQSLGGYNLVIIDSIGNHLRGNESFTNDFLLSQKIEQQETEMKLDSVDFHDVSDKHLKQLHRFFKSHPEYELRIRRKLYLTSLYKHLSEIAESHNVAVVVANQVADQLNDSKYVSGESDDPLNFTHQLGQFFGWDNATIHRFQREFGEITPPPERPDGRLEQPPHKLTEVLAERLEQAPKRQKQNRQHETAYEELHLVGRMPETRRIVPSLGFAWAKPITCRLLLLKFYRPIVSHSLAPQGRIDSDTGLTYDQLVEGFEPGPNPQDEVLGPELQGWELHRYIKVVCHPYTTINRHNLPSKIPFTISSHSISDTSDGYE